MNRTPRSPREPTRLPVIVRILLHVFVIRVDRPAVYSELAELYETRRERDGKKGSRVWLARQINQYPPRIIAARLRRVFRSRGERPDQGVRERRPAREFMTGFVRDIRHSVRCLSRVPVFTLTIAITLGLGIGGTTAVFSIVNAVLVQPLPYPGSERMVRIYTDMGRSEQWGLSLADYLALADQQTSFDDVAMFRSGTVTLNSDELSERIPIRIVTPNLFSLLGIAPARGRAFVETDAGEQRVMLSHGFWTRRFGADVAAVGESVRLDARDYTVIGILPRNAGPLLEGRDIFAVMPLEPPSRKGPFGMFVVGRLKRNVDRRVASQELRAINERIFPFWQASWPDQESTWAMEDLKQSIVGDVGKTLSVVLGAAVFVLLIASTNAANLLVARGLQRRPELAVRAVLGGSRGRLLQHLLSESALLATGGAIFGLLLAMGGIRLITTLGSDFIPRSEEIGLTPPVVWFFVAITAASTLLFGLIPSLQLSRSNLESDFRGTGTRNTASLGSRRLRRALVVSQFAVTVPLLVGAGLLISSLAKLGRVDPGFEPSNVLTLRVSLPGTVYGDQGRRLAFWADLTNRVGALPGVEAAGLSTGRPPLQSGFGNNFVLEDRAAASGEAQLSVPWAIVSPDYFGTLGIPLITGRMLDDRDGGDPFNVMVDRRWATRFFGDESAAIGKRFRHGACTGEGCPWANVVGVVGDVKYTGLENAGDGQIYVSLQRWTNTSMYVIVRTETDPLSVLPSVRAVIRELDSTLPISQTATMPELIRDSLIEPRYLSTLVAGFALVALVLAVVGIYGVMAYFVHQHTKDIGIRIALGGTPSTVRNLVLTNGMKMVGVGMMVGLVGAFALTRFMANLLFEVRTTDPLTFVAVSVGILMIALTACVIPAQRAARTDPSVSLRSD